LSKGIQNSDAEFKSHTRLKMTVERSGTLFFDIVHPKSAMSVAWRRFAQSCHHFPREIMLSMVASVEALMVEVDAGACKYFDALNVKKAP
jgi:hypothetical protein